MNKKNLLLFSLCLSLSCQPSKGRVLHEKYSNNSKLSLSKAEWSQRGGTGQIQRFLRDGTLSTENYRHFLLQGESTQTHPYSTEIATWEWFERGECRERKSYSSSGILLQEERFSPLGKRSVRSWFCDGAPRFIEEYSKNEEREILESGEYFSPRLEVESCIDRGEGERIVRDTEAEQILLRQKVSEGQITEEKAYFPTGTLERVTHYAEGKREGEEQLYSPSGELLAKIPHRKGKREGKELRFREGKVVEEISWKADVREGPTRIFCDGSTPLIEWYHRGKRVSKIKYQLLHPFTQEE